MYLKRFRAENYRNIGVCDLTFDKGVNLLVGENAQGKTNALEGIYAFARGKSFRGATDKELVKFGETGFQTEITFEDRNRQQILFYSFEDGKRKRLRNHAPLKSLNEAMGHFRAVLFYPEHLSIVKGGPAERRELINVAIAQLDTQYIRDYAAYQKILDNRNYLLKQAQKGMYIDENELSAWSEKLAEYAARIHTRRVEYVNGISPFASSFLRDISSEKEEMRLSYQSDTEEKEEVSAYGDYLKAFTEHLEREKAAGCTLFGVHRDDIDIFLGGVSARTYASQGQQRSCVLSLKLAEGEYAKKLTGDSPVYLFDDVLSELDKKRQSYVLGMQDERQIILTACDQSLLGRGYNEIHVSGGTYASAHR